jgi:hypothetical protein
MTPLRYLLTLLLLGVTTMSHAGDIQILCEPDLRVYVDDELVGRSSAREDGLAIENVPPGTHLVRVEKDGFLPQSFEVEILDLPIEIKVGEFYPAPPSAQPVEPDDAEVQHLVGSLVVTSSPQNCEVEIDGETQTKDAPHLVIGGLAPGEHTIVFRKEGYEPVSEVIEIHAGAEITVRGDFKSGQVDVVFQGKGTLRVISRPSHCTVRFMGEIKEKTRSYLNVSHVPAGEHPITLSMPGRELTTTVLILDRTRTTLKVNFVKGEEPFSVSYAPK